MVMFGMFSAMNVSVGTFLDCPTFESESEVCVRMMRLL